MFFLSFLKSRVNKGRDKRNGETSKYSNHLLLIHKGLRNIFSSLIDQGSDNAILYPNMSKPLSQESYLKTPLRNRVQAEVRGAELEITSADDTWLFNVDFRTIGDLERLFTDQSPHLRNGDNDKLTDGKLPQSYRAGYDESQASWVAGPCSAHCCLLRKSLGVVGQIVPCEHSWPPRTSDSDLIWK